MARIDENGSPQDDTGLVAGSDAAAPAAASEPVNGGLPVAEPGWPEVDRRLHSDRREQPTGLLDKVLRRGRRKAGRRTGERDNIYVDRYSKVDVGILLAIFILNIGDALFTLLWLQRGGGEGNPVMQAMLDIGVGAFLFQKCIIVGIWLLILTAHRNYKTARIGLWSTLSVYTLLIIYHLLLVGVDPVIRDPETHPTSGSAMSESSERSKADASIDPAPMTSDMTSEMPTEQDGHGRLDAQGPVAQTDGA